METEGSHNHFLSGLPVTEWQLGYQKPGQYLSRGCRTGFRGHEGMKMLPFSPVGAALYWGFISGLHSTEALSSQG